MVQGWYRFSCPEDPKFKNSIIKIFSSNGVHLKEFHVNHSGKMGLLFIRNIDEYLFEKIRKINQDGLQRIIVIAQTPGILEGKIPWLLLEAGAEDVVGMNLEKDRIENLCAKIKNWQKVDKKVSSDSIRKVLIGDSPRWILTLRQLVEIGLFTDASVLLLGETGTGKECAARLIHDLDPRKEKKELVVLDCTTVVSDLSGSEFFGHENGAFTGAVGRREGSFFRADGGTLFLDEVGELPLPLQAQLLRVIQEKTYKRVGGNEWFRTDFRLICATNRDLYKDVQKGKFRRDLFYRIANCTITLPSLSHRRSDVLILAEYFLKQLAPNGAPPKLDPMIQDWLMKKEYPGNIRELKQVCYRIFHKHMRGPYYSIGDIPYMDRPKVDLPLPEQNQCSEMSVEASKYLQHKQSLIEQAIENALNAGKGWEEFRRDAQETAIRLSLERENYNTTRAAKLLKVNPRTIQKSKKKCSPLSDTA